MAKRKTTEQFISDAIAVHGNRYDYSKVVYKTGSDKVTIICSVHGEFQQKADNHLQGKGCGICANSIKSNTKEFIKKSKVVHHNKYDYLLADYKNSKTKVIIICPEHGEFEQTPKDHLKGRGCQKCKYAYLSHKFSSNIDEFIQKAVKIHGVKYDYSKAIYVNWDTNINITCPIHGAFEQRVGNHLNGKGCPGCAKGGFDPNKPAYLYYLKVTTNEGKELYKIGITNRTVDERFNLTDLSKIEIVKQKLYENGADAMNWETKLKRKYKDYQYTGPDVLSSGNTELFTEDLLQLFYNG